MIRLIPRNRARTLRKRRRLLESGGDSAQATWLGEKLA
jgi:hypothetical protein